MTGRKLIHAPRGLPDAAVPCGGCTTCCRSGVIVVWPEYGDDPARFKTERANLPDLGEVTVLRRKRDGSCIHLEPEGCAIYEHRPVVCRKFDCRTMVLEIMQEPRRYRRAQTKSCKAVMAEGRKRLDTLKSAG